MVKDKLNENSSSKSKSDLKEFKYFGRKIPNLFKVKKNNEVKALVQKYKKKKEALKKALYQKGDSISGYEKFSISQELSKIPRKASKCRIRNRCVVTGRARGYRRKYSCSRSIMRQMFSEAKFSGVIKSSW